MAVMPSPTIYEVLAKWLSLAVLLGGVLYLGANIWSIQMGLNHTEKVLLIEQLEKIRECRQ